MDAALQIAGIAIAVVVIAFLGWRAYKKNRDTPEAVKTARKSLRAAESDRKKALQPIDRSLAQHRKSLVELTSTTGKKLGKYAKVTLYELRVETPSGSGDLSSAVDAFVDDASSSRFTATRFLTVGVFALAFKKKTGKVFLSIDHPNFVHLSEVGPKERESATKFAAKVKNAGRQAEALRVERPKEVERIRALVTELEHKKTDAESRHESIVDAAGRAVADAEQATGFSR